MGFLKKLSDYKGLSDYSVTLAILWYGELYLMRWLDYRENVGLLRCQKTEVSLAVCSTFYSIFLFSHFEELSSSGALRRAEETLHMITSCKTSTSKLIAINDSYKLLEKVRTYAKLCFPCAVKPVVKTACIERPPLSRDHCRLVHMPPQ